MNILDALLTKSIPTTLRGRVRHTGGAFPDDMEVEDGYPSDAAVEAIGLVAFDDVDRWMRDMFPAALRSLPCVTVDVAEVDGKCEIQVSTGGWSGVESVVWEVLEHPIMRMSLATKHRGGHYVFLVPLATRA